MSKSKKARETLPRVFEQKNRRCNCNSCDCDGEDLFSHCVASATECTGRNAEQPVNRSMADGFEDIYKTPPKPVGKSKKQSNYDK